MSNYVLSMKDEIRLRWATALTSGVYTQGTASLVTKDNRHCCLGVLCRIAEQDGVVEFDATNREFLDGEDRYGDMLPTAVCHWAGLATTDPWLMSVDGTHNTASDWNDELGATFEDIAAMVLLTKDS